MPAPRRALAAAPAALACLPFVALGAQITPRDGARDTTRARPLAAVRVVGRADRRVGVARTASEGRVGAAELRARPTGREGEVLEAVPGLIVTQHSGDGKANQYFVRGFNLDHGTDFQTRVDGVPVNMPTHGHGQGYTDLNFLIPELVDHLDYRLGTSHADVGDFGSAGAADVRLVRALDRPFAAVETGQNGLARLALGASRPAFGGDLLVGGEGKAYDGPWVRAERVRKGSGLVRFARDRGASSFALTAMAYGNRWDASDQVARRAVAGGRIPRFGQIDSTDGGRAARYSLAGEWRRAGARGEQGAHLYAVRSALDLFSNFTFFLDDPEGGDQFAQADRRTVLGGDASAARRLDALGASHRVRAGVQARTDLIDRVGLYRTTARVRTATVREDRVRETGTGVWADVESRWRPWVRTVVGAREDLYTFDVRGDLAANAGRRAAAIASPKASVVFAPARSAELYVSGGFGFHSNDARGAVIRVDPATGGSARRVDPLVRSRGAEVGARVEPLGGALRGLRATATAWALGLDSELLFTGDAGTTDAAAASRRRGLTFANFYRPPALPALALDADVSFARARFRGVGPGADRVPGALERVVAGGVAWNPPDRGLGRAGAFGAARVRHFGAYPLTEDGAVRARAATLVGAEAGYQLRGGTRVRALLLNAFDARADDVQYYYASRLPGEPAQGVDDVHVHPAEPRQVRLLVDWRF